MEDRKSVLETVTPTDALGRLSARQKHGKAVLMLAGVLLFLVVLGLIALVVSNAGQGTRGIEVPQVTT